MDTTTILPTPPTSGAIVHSGGNYDRGDCIEELITNNNIADNSRAILTAIANGNAAIIAADQTGHLVNQKTTGDASVANLKATYDAQVASINATNIGIVSATKAVTDNGIANLGATERNAGEIRMNIAKESGENRIQTAIASGEIRELINTTATTNLLAIKDNLHAIDKEGCRTREVVFAESCKTREQEAEHFAKLQYQAEKNKNDIEKEMLKGFAATQLEALKNKCELESKLAECCCELKEDGAATRALILSENTKRLETELQEARLKAAIAGLGNCDKNSK